MLFWGFLNNLLQDAYIIFQKGVDYFEHKHANLGVGGAFPLKTFRR